MSVNRIPIGLKVTTVLIFMQFSQFFNTVNAQLKNNQNWDEVSSFLEQNLSNLGGRLVMHVWKGDKIVYKKNLNNISQRKEAMAKMMARKTGKNTAEFLEDFDDNTKQRIASSSKWLTAALAMTFVDDHQLQLDDSIGKYLPIMTANRKGQIKVWQCLSHLTGIKQIGIMGQLNGNSDGEDNGNTETNRSNFRGKIQANRNGANNRQNSWKTMEAAMDSIAHQPMEGEPGKTFHYGNAGLQIVAAILEKISNKPFKILFAERLTKPLGMTNTDFGDGPVPLAAGGAWSTPNDYLKFLQMMLQKGSYNGKQILTAASVAAMQQNRIVNDVIVKYSPTEAGNWGYGFGEWVDKNSTAFASSPGLFGSFPWINNDKQYAAFLFVVNLKSKGRHDLYQNLKASVDKALSQ